MKQLLLAIIIFITSQMVTAQTLKLEDLGGTWFVNQSNFPMWLKGNKTNPTFNYTLTTKHGKPVLLDEVQYLKKSKTRKIVGYDKPQNAGSTSFVWRGKGILGFVKSKWSILYFDPEKQWMIIHFEKTLFTPEGYDVVSKYKTPGTQLQEKVDLKLTELGIHGLIKIKQE